MLASATVDAIFARMLVRYGAAWAAKWAGVPPEGVKADWARELSGLSREAIVYALGYLPEDFPPTVLQFRAICMRAPSREPERPKLEAPKADPERLKAELARLRSLQERRGSRDWAYALQEREKAGEQLTPAQRASWRAALETAPIERINGEFTPIKESALPPGMRAANDPPVVAYERAEEWEPA